MSVRYRDLDTNNHVTNSVYFNYFEQARAAIFHQAPSFREVFETPRSARPYTSVLVHTEAQFKAQAFLNQQLIIGGRITALRRVFIDSEYAVFDKESGSLIAKGKAINVMIALDGYKTITVPSNLVKDLEKIEGRKLV